MPVANSSNITTIQILRSYSNTTPTTLDDGQLAYSFISNTLFIGSNTGIKVISNPPTDLKAQEAYNQANTATVLAQAGYNQANVTIGVDASQNARMSISDGVNTSQNVRLDFSNTRMAISDGVNVSQNVRLDFSNTRMTIIEGVDVGQNTRMTVSDGVNTSQNVRLDFSNTRMTIIEGVDAGQNSRMTISDGVNASQNSRLDFSNTRMTIIEGVDVTQNTNIANKLSLSGASYQTVSGNVAFLNDVSVSGNLIVLGNTISLNVTSLEVKDTLIQLGIGNYNTDVLTIGYVGHYNDGTNAQAGMIRDAGTKEFYAFQGYTPGVTGNTVNINDASFAKANIHGNWFKGNLIATTARVGGLDVNSRLDFSNTRMTIIEGVDVGQNNRMTIIEGTDVSQNARIAVSEGVDLSQNVRLDFSNTRMNISDGVNVSQNVRLDFSNTRMTIIEGVDVGQNTRLTVSEGVDLSQNVRIDYSNTALTIAQGVNNSQNVRLDFSNTRMNIIEGVDAGQNARMTIIEGTDTSQNARMTIIEGTDLSQNVRLDFSNTRMTIIEGVDVGQNTRMTVSDGVNASQNVRLDYSNTAITIIQGVDVGQNARMVIIEGTDASQNVRLDFSNTRMTIIEGVDVTQNTNISTVTVLAQAAFNRANTEPDSFSYLANTVVVANSTGYLSNSGVFFTSSNNNLIVSGNVQVSNGSITTPARELTLGVTGDTFGTQLLRMQNRGGQNGPLFDGTSSSVALVDFGFKTVNGQRNIRYETRGGAEKYISSGDGLEFQIGEAGSPTLVTSNNSVLVRKTTGSTSTTTGALVVNGGVGIAGNVYSGMHYITGSGNGIVFVDSTVQTTAGSSVANTVYLQGVDNSQNVRIDYSNTALTIAQGVDNSQNVRIDYSNAAITIIQGTDTTQNTRLTVIEGTNASQNVRLDYSNTAITIIQGVDVTQNTRLTVSEGVDLSQNVRLDFSNTRMNIIDGVDAGQNARMTIIEGVDVTQNTNIANRLALTGAASQTVTGNVVFGNDVTVTGNLVILGNTISLNVSSLEVEDTLIQLGIGNYYTDALTIGYVGHYNDGTNAHAGMIRDAVTKEFYAFQGYTPEASGNVINVNAASFTKANIHGNWFKGNLIATTARVGGLDVNSRLDFSNTRMTIIEGVDVTQNTNIAATDGKMQSAYNVANTADVRSVAAYFHANGAFIKANAAFDQANVTIGVDVSQNSRMTIIEGTDLSQNVRLDYSNTALTIAQGVDNSQNVRIDYSNAAITIIQGVDTSQNARMVIIEGTDTSQNARMTIADGVNASQNVRLDYSNTAITIIQGVDNSQNVRIDYSNAAITIIQGVDVTQNTRLTVSEGVDLSQNVRIDYSNTALTIAQGVDNSQNVRLDYSNTVINQIQSAWTANTVIVANSAGFLSNSVMRFDASTSHLHSMANLSIGTSTSSAPLTVSKTFSLLTGGEQFNHLNSVAYTIADSGLKQNLRLNTTATHTSGTLNELMGILSLSTGGGVGGTTLNQYGIWVRNDVSAGAAVTNSYNYVAINSGGLGGPSNQYGFHVANLTKGLLSNYGFYGGVNTGNNAFNLYMAGTAPNYLAGSLTVANNVPSTSNTTGSLVVTGGIGVSGNVYSTGGSITINNGFATTGNSGTIFLGDSSFSKTFGSGFTFNSSINAQQFVANPGSNSAAAFTFSGVGNLGIYAPLTGVLGITANSANALFVSAPASSVNYLNVSANTTGNAPTIRAIGSDANVNFNLVTQGSGTFSFLNSNTTNGIIFRKNNVDNEWQVIANNTSNLGLVSTGGGSIYFYTATGGAQRQFAIATTSSAVNYAQVTGNTTGNGPTISAQGSDANVDLNLLSKGTGYTNFNTIAGTHLKVGSSSSTALTGRVDISGDPSSRGIITGVNSLVLTSVSSGSVALQTNSTAHTQFAATHTASAVNYLQATGAATLGQPVLSGQGSDTNVGININPKGAGSVNVTSTASSTSNTSGALVVNGGLGLSGNLTMSIVPNVGRLTLSPTHFIYNDSAGIVFSGTNYYYFNNTGGVYNQTALIQRGPIYNDVGNTTVLFAGTSQVKIQNGTGSSNTTTGALVVQGGVGISGALNATTKSFNIPHPTKEGKDLRYGSLEGPEFGVYVRGTLKGSNIIELPDYWTKLVDANTITVSLTPIGKHQKLSVKEVKDNTIIINSDGWFKKEIHCYYVVYGERADVDKLDVEG
jgi:hypothetical protein